jgi:hypothetical protein
MSFRWRDYIELAQELNGKRTKPYHRDAKLRSAISRAYYGAFVEARNFIEDVDGVNVPKGGAAHGFVADYFEYGTANPTRVRIGINLGNLRTLRNLADYENVIYTLPKRVQDSIRLSLQIIKLLDQL